MVRLILALSLLLCCLPTARATTVAPKHEPDIKKKDLPPPEIKEEDQQKEDGELILNEDTEVQLDGKACKYENLPADVEIVVLDLASDHKTIKKIHFRTKAK
jgi:hypothetical protein